MVCLYRQGNQPCRLSRIRGYLVRGKNGAAFNFCLAGRKIKNERNGFSIVRLVSFVFGSMLLEKAIYAFLQLQTFLPPPRREVRRGHCSTGWQEGHFLILLVFLYSEMASFPFWG